MLIYAAHSPSHTLTHTRTVHTPYAKDSKRNNFPENPTYNIDFYEKIA